MRYLEFVANVLAKAPVPHITSNGGPAVLLVGAAVFVAVAWTFRTGWRPSRRVTTLTVAVFPLLVWTAAVAKGPPSSLTVRFFDVGQGDSALVTSPAGASILVDGGPDDEQVATYLAGVGMKRIDVIVASHPHADHIIGLPAVFAEVQVGLVLEPGCPDDSFQSVDATVAVVSVGGNTYGQPLPATLDAIAETGAQSWRTDQHGTLTVTFQDHTPVVASER